jgi:heme oxygenase
MSTRRPELSSRLRVETLDLHKSTESALGIPGSVRSRTDYVRLLLSSWAFYSAARDALADARWIDRWSALGVNLPIHDRVPLLEGDLRALGVEPDARAAALDIDTFAHAVGLLYVVEGSSLGGRFIGPAIAERIGDVPISFYLGEGRTHPKPWRSVVAALADYEATESDLDGVIEGARRAFVAFGETVSIDRELAA